MPYLALGAGLVASSFVGVARVGAGKHFITDVLGAAVVGSSVGIVIPSLHKSPVRVVPVVGDGQRGLEVAGAF